MLSKNASLILRAADLLPSSLSCVAMMSTPPEGSGSLGSALGLGVGSTVGRVVGRGVAEIRCKMVREILECTPAASSVALNCFFFPERL